MDARGGLCYTHTMNEELKTYLDEQFAMVRGDIAGIREQVAENTVVLTGHSEVLKDMRRKVNATFELVAEHETKLIEL